MKGELIDTPEDYNIVSEIARHYNFTEGLNYELKKKFGNKYNFRKK